MSRKRTRSRSSSQSLLPLFLILAGTLLVVGVLIWQAVRNNARTNTVTPTQAPQAQSNLPFPEVSRVPVPDAKQAYDSQSAVFVDVRDAGSFSQGHIPGSINIPVDEFESRVGELDPQKWIITYCT